MDVEGAVFGLVWELLRAEVAAATGQEHRAISLVCKVAAFNSKQRTVVGPPNGWAQAGHTPPASSFPSICDGLLPPSSSNLIKERKCTTASSQAAPAGHRCTHVLQPAAARMLTPAEVYALYLAAWVEARR